MSQDFIKMMTDDEIISVVQAHKEGKAIQGRWHDESQWWLLTQSGAWARFHQCDYRVAPEPPTTAGELQPREWSVHVTKEAYPHEMITSFPVHQDSIKETILVREVIE